MARPSPGTTYRALGWKRRSKDSAESIRKSGRQENSFHGSKTLIADWDDARRADNYRLRAVTKADGKEVANEIAQDTQFSLTLTKVAAGAVGVLTVSARNATGESPAGNAVEITVP